MKKSTLLILLLCAFSFAKAQNYSPLDYYYSGTPSQGIKIKTNIPFQNTIGMPTIMLEGYEYGGAKVIDLKIVWYVYDNKFYRHSIVSSGSYTPDVYLENVDGKINIFIDHRGYYTRFTVRAYAKGKAETPTMFEGWTSADEGLVGSVIQKLEYVKHLTDKVIINNAGNMGIGTTSPDAKLTVKGNIHAQEVKVDLNGAVAPDYVFEPDYSLMTLQELSAYLKEHKHLPEVPSAKEMEQNGVNLLEMNLLLLKKVEELTLHLIELERKNKKLEEAFILKK